MASVVEGVIDFLDDIVAWLNVSLKQTTAAYCDIQTADSPDVLVSTQGGLLSIIEVRGVRFMVGKDEFFNIQDGLLQSLQSNMSRSGHTMQVFFSYNPDGAIEDIRNAMGPSVETAKRLQLNVRDLFEESEQHLARYCAREKVYIVLWTHPNLLTKEQLKRAHRDKQKMLKEDKTPPFRYTQNLMAAIPDLRDTHNSFVRAVGNDLDGLGIVADLLKVHDAIYAVRSTVDPNFTARTWRPILPGDKFKPKISKRFKGEASDIMWPSLAMQLFPRDAENINLSTCKIGDRIYANVFIDLFPKELKKFMDLFVRTIQMKMPWRISFLIDSAGISSMRMKTAFSSILAFSSSQNRLINDAANLLRYIDVNTDDAVVKLRVTATTWAGEDEMRVLRTNVAQLAKAIEGWGSCNVSEVCGDPFAGTVSSMMGVSSQSVATTSVAPLSHVLHMLPLFRPSSPWKQGAFLLRSPDGKLWPYQPGSKEQTTWIDLIYARPGSGKSVLSNAINLALVVSAGIPRLPRIAVIDIGPSSSGLISLLREALPADQRHLVAYHRLRMTSDYAINPFDTQLGCRYPTPQDRSFLVNFLTLLVTPVGAKKPYDGVTDMVGMVVDELYKTLADNNKPNTYTPTVEAALDGILEEIGFVIDSHTTWWEATDALFTAGFEHEAMLAQRHCMPLLSDAASICRSSAVEDLYGKIIAPTGESLIAAFSRMISSAVREYPIIAQITRFDLADVRIASLDLDEVAKSGGDAADRQTAIMYMLARYILARHYYLNEQCIDVMPKQYHDYHEKRILEIREDPKRIVFDEFHRTAKVQAVRDQVIQDMREGRKWNVQIALLSQSLDDFDTIMVEFATAIFMMDAGPEQAIEKTSKVFGLSKTARLALRSYVHGPRPEGATFLAQFATKEGVNTQLLTCTLGPIELWAFSTTAEDVVIRNRLYSRIGPLRARRILAKLFPSGSSAKTIESRLTELKERRHLVDEEARFGVIDQLIEEILKKCDTMDESFSV